MKKWIAILMIILTGSAAGMQKQAEDGLRFSENQFLKDYTKLASDEFLGRGTGQEGGRIAADYLSKRFTEIGLLPAGDRDTFFQNIPMHSSMPLKSTDLKIYLGEKEIRPVLGEDYLLYKTGDQAFLPKPVEMVFVGYGIIAPEFDYNDYQNVDIEGKIAVMIGGEPASDDPGYFNGEAPTVYSYPDIKQRLALSRGAAGSIIIPDPYEYMYNDWDKLKNAFEFENVTLSYTVSSHLSMTMNFETGANLFNGAEFSLFQVYDLYFKNKMKSFPLKSKLSFRGKFRQKDFLAPNVIGYIKGTDRNLSNEYILLSAHYDHLGIGPAVDGDSIYNGAFDNAAGTAALLQIAEYFAENPLKRSVIILMTTGEEHGLLGSTYYTHNPVFPLYKTVANINIDGLAFIDEFESVIGIGAKLSTLNEHLKNAALRLDLEVVDIPPGFEDSESFNRSDQIAFAKAGVPSMLIMDGTEYRNTTSNAGMNRIVDYISDYYHTPFDDTNLSMNVKAAMQHISIIAEMAIEAGNAANTPYWTEGTDYLNYRLQSEAEKR
ncbi:MAG: M28 family peptidase [Candidatus Kapaibacterium sp.]